MIYAKLDEILDSKNVYISTIFRQKGSSWSSGWHNGVDIAAAQGTPIKAAGDGVVVNADTVAHNDGFGNRVVIKHTDGKATLYAHMVSAPPVKVGQTVKRGQVIGNVGNTGLSYGAHLHFTVINNYEKNPNIYYAGDLLDPIIVCGLGSLKFGSSCSSTIVQANGVVKNLGDLNKYYSNSGSSGQTVIPDNPTPKADTPTTSLKIGDVVNFTGSTHYAGSTIASGISCKPGKAKITNIAKNAAHPYHLIAESGGGSTVYGWVNASDVQTLNSNSNKKSIDEIALEVIRGDWGNGDDRFKRLTAAGYDPKTVQTRVNQML